MLNSIVSSTSRKKNILANISARFLILLVVTILALIGCLPSKPPGVEVLVTKDEDTLLSMTLSPKGDKLIYDSRSVREPVVLDLITGAKKELNSGQCGIQSWIDNQIIFCWGGSHTSPVLVDSRDWAQVEVREVNLAEIDLESLLAKADKVIALRRYRKKDIHDILILPQGDWKSAKDNYVISDVENIEQTLQGIPYQVILSKSPLDEKMYSPDGKYYYIHRFGVSLAIYSSDDDSLLAKYTLDKNDRNNYRYTQAKVAGWIYDSGGVIFRGVTPPLWHSPILILKVPR